MYAFSTRLVCSLVVLAGFFGEQGASYEAVPVSLAPTFVPGEPAMHGSDVPLAVIADADQAGESADSDGVVLRRVYRVTAYCDRGTTAAGVPSGLGQCAAPADIPFGSLIYIPALDRTFVVTDRTARRFRYNTVDLFIPSRARCKQFGRHYLECEITVPKHPARYGSKHLLHSADRAARMQ